MRLVLTSDRWIPDGQLCPTVPNRSNYIHWIGDLLKSDLIPTIRDSNALEQVRGFDIGTGANCIYPLLGASLLGWSFVGSGINCTAYKKKLKFKLTSFIPDWCDASISLKIFSFSLQLFY